MEKEKFTKEQIEFIRNDFRDSPLSWDDYLDSLLKPETKFIDVRIEYQLNKFGSDVILYEHDVLKCLTEKVYFSSVLKVTELPEVFTREEVLSLFIGYTCIPPCEVDNYMNDVISERKSK